MPDPHKSHTICPDCVIQRRITKESDRSQTKSVKADPEMEGHIKRKCLRCDKEFISEGIHNRMCKPCKGYS